MSLSRFCRKPVAYVLPEQTADEAALTMRERHVGSLVVVREDLVPVGMLTDRDLVTRVLAERSDPTAVLVGDVMTEGISLIHASARVDEALYFMRKRGVRRLPIVNGDGRLAGIVALDDLLVLLSAELDMAAHTVRDNAGP
jgi:CBS domain-containing protein